MHAAVRQSRSPEGAFTLDVLHLANLAGKEREGVLHRAIRALVREVAAVHDPEDVSLVFNDLLNEIDPAWRVKLNENGAGEPL